MQALRAQLHEQEWKLRRAEAEHEKSLAAYTRFVQDVVASSSSPVLGKYVDLSTKEVLGSGHFGYVFTCRARIGAFTSGEVIGPERIVVKVQSARQADSVVREWHHGSTCKHPHVVEHLKVLLHQDPDGEIRRFLEEAFSSGALKGKPRTLPDKWLCILEEYMDGGTAQYLMDRQLLHPEGVAAILRQVADAVYCLHQSQGTHNDIKPENVLLKVDSRGGGRVKLVAKLADMGSAEYSVNRTRDNDLLAYTVWCMVMGAAFKKCPSGDEERRAALEEMRQAAAAWSDRQLQQGLPGTIEQLWRGSCDLQELMDAPWLRGRELTVPENVLAGTELQSAARRSLLNTEKRRSSLMNAVARIKCIVAPSPRGEMRQAPLRAEIATSTVVEAACSSEDDSAKEEVSPPLSSGIPSPAATAASAGSFSRPYPADFDNESSSLPVTRGRSSSAGVVGRSQRRGAPAHQGRLAEESPRPPSIARPPGGGAPRRPLPLSAMVSGGDAADERESDDDILTGNFTMLASSSSAGDVRGPESKESTSSNSKADNLMRRFPSRTRDEVLEALREACGHAGHAADMLRKAAE